ncbi:MAG TPA: hypothetical protein PLO62_12460 [Candidatus Hydrogenedentes bacterium]|nr:hypothetical protein [Candidatus Hydrogenedentota bacterium]HOS03385.1 hypothetical protein [Candidatus Hydrogenedentota bacterium]
MRLLRKWRISNRRLLIGSILGFLGSLIVTIDKFPGIHELIDTLQPFSDTAYGIKAMDAYSYTQSDNQKVGVLRSGERGFDNLVRVIKTNRPEIKDKIVAIAQNSPMTLGGVPTKIVHVQVAQNSTQPAIPLTSEFIFREWVAKAREQHFSE